MAPTLLGKHGHAVAHPAADQRPFLFRGAPEHAEQHLGRRRGEVDSATDLGQPERDAEVLEQGIDRAVLDRRTEGPSELTYYDCVPSVGALLHLSEEPAGLRAPRPRQGSADPDVEELLDDLGIGWEDPARLGELSCP